MVQRKDVTIQSKNVEMGEIQLILRHFKTIKNNDPIILSITSNKDPQLCPVRALQTYFNFYSHTEGPLFQFIGGSPVSYNFVTLNLRKAITFIGLDPLAYKGHSFRIGAATQAAKSGFSESYIQQLGRWNSNAMKRYIRIQSFQL